MNTPVIKVWMWGKGTYDLAPLEDVVNYRDGIILDDITVSNHDGSVNIWVSTTKKEAPVMAVPQ